jgi:hypothetical protein
VPLVLTTVVGAERLSGRHDAAHAEGLAPWDARELTRPDGGVLTVTAVPARHGPEGFEERTGPVTGFVLTAPDLPTVYVSGDNASLGWSARSRTGSVRWTPRWSSRAPPAYPTCTGRRC